MYDLLVMACSVALLFERETILRLGIHLVR